MVGYICLMRRLGLVKKLIMTPVVIVATIGAVVIVLPIIAYDFIKSIKGSV
jgi:hypothetical protein